MAKRRTRKPQRKAVRVAKRSPLRAIEAALAAIAHDIRTPLTGIVALAELLATSNVGSREREWANAIKSGADHLTGLTTLIVDAVRSDAHRLVLHREPFSPRRLAEAVAATLSARAGNRGLKAEIALAPDLPAMVAGDALRLRAALENLTDNAVKFTADGAVMFTAAAKPAGQKRVQLIFTVTDTGIGIRPRDIKRLFRPFAQASEAVARRYGGAGLGLVFVKRVARAMGGDIKVTSKKGHGTTFRLIAPAERIDLPAERVATHAAPKRTLAILCVEDNPHSRVVINTILNELGHRVEFVESGEAAVKTVEIGGHDAVLMNVALTGIDGIDGIEATRRIRSLPGKSGQVPVIGISSRGEGAEEAAARASGMNFYLVKPVSLSGLAQALADIS